MADRQAQIPGGAYLNDAEEATLYQRQIPGFQYVNDTQEAAGGDISVSVTGNALTITSGTATVTGTANVSPTGNQLLINAGTVTVSVGENVNAEVTGVSATISVGTATATGDANVTATGASAAISAGALTVTGTANVSLTGNQALINAGSVTVDTGGNVTVDTTGVSATITTGVLSATGDANVTPTGVQMSMAAGTVSFGGDVVGEPTVVVSGGGGWSPRRRRTINEYIVKVGEKTYRFDSMEEAIAFLNESRVKLKPRIEEEAEKAARRILRTKGKARQKPVRKPELVTVEMPEGRVTEPLARELQLIEREFDIALQAILAREAEIEDVLWIAKHL